MASYNQSLGKFNLVDLPPAATRNATNRSHLRHRCQRHCACVGKGPRNKQRAIHDDHRARHHLSKDKIDRDDSEMPRSTPKTTSARRDEAEVRNNADSLVYQTEKVLREQGDKVTEEEKAAVEGPLADSEDCTLRATMLKTLKAATETLMGASQAFSQKLYEAAARDSECRRHISIWSIGAVNDDDIVDAEIVDEQ